MQKNSNFKSLVPATVSLSSGDDKNLAYLGFTPQYFSEGAFLTLHTILSMRQINATYLSKIDTKLPRKATDTKIFDI